MAQITLARRGPRLLLFRRSVSSRAIVRALEQAGIDMVFACLEETPADLQRSLRPQEHHPHCPGARGT